MDANDRHEVTQDLAAMRGIARRLRERSGVPVVESCARWCEMYSQVALWSLGEEDRFQFMDTVPLTEEKPRDQLGAG
jgi:hypothetical protein